MAIQREFHAEGDLLNVKASGVDDSLADVNAYGSAIIQAALQNGSRRILCDETDLTYKLSVADTFESARFISENAPHVVKAAIVCKPQSFEDGQFWENVAVNRGLTVKFFRNLAEAAAWLDAKPQP